MSGFPCAECGRNVQDEICDHCGHHTPTPAREEPAEPSTQLSAITAALEALREARHQNEEKK